MEGGVVALVLTETNGEQTRIDSTGGFVGAASDLGFSRLSLFAVGTPQGFHNFRIDNVALESVPEASITFFLGSALVAFTLARCRWGPRVKAPGRAAL